MGYWDATDRYLSSHGGQGPICPKCGERMFPQDDHGRFTCPCSIGSGLNVTTGLSFFTRPIPQVDTREMTDEQKARVPLVNRLHDTPTAAEAALFRVYRGGPDAIGTPEYREAVAALERERDEA